MRWGAPGERPVLPIMRYDFFFDFFGVGVAFGFVY
jgi:hypothetical protein